MGVLPVIIIPVLNVTFCQIIRMHGFRRYYDRWKGNFFEGQVIFNCVNLFFQMLWCLPALLTLPTPTTTIAISCYANEERGYTVQNGDGLNGCAASEFLIEIEVASVFLLLLRLVFFLIGAGHDAGFLVVTHAFFEEVGLAGQ